MDFDSNFLIVDDEAVIRKIAINFLKKAGYKNFHVAEDGSKAIEVLKFNDIDVIIADWNMPNVTGMELLDRTREDEKWRNIPFIMLTAEAHEDNVIAAGLHDATAYIIKPFTANTLLTKVSMALRRKKRSPDQSV